MIEQKTKEALFKKLSELSIEYKTYFHEPLFTCQQAIEATSLIPATQCKNLFLKDDKKNLYLVVAVSDISHETKIHFKALSQYLKTPGLRFANSQLLHQYLGVQPGSVTPFGLICDTEHKVVVLLDVMLFKAEYIGFHPLENNATTVIVPTDLIKFVQACMNHYSIVNFSEIENNQ